MKILLIQLRRIGDILLATPVISYLKKNLSQSSLDFLSEPLGRDLLEGNPHVNEFLIYNKGKSLSEILRIRSKNYDAVLDFMGNPRSALLTGLSGAKWRVGFNRRGRSFFYNLAVKVPEQPEYGALRKIRMVQAWLKKINTPFSQAQKIRPEIYLNSQDENFAQEWMRKENLEGNTFVILAPAHRHEIRQWRAEGFREVGLRLSRKNDLKVFLAWGPSEGDLMEQIRKGVENELRLLPPTTLRQMAALFKKAKLVISNDSGAMHLAVAVGTSTVTLYGPTRPIDWNPSLAGLNNLKQDIPLTAPDVACLGCHLGTCYVGHLCMTHLKEQEVVKAAETLLNEEKK